jgi:hypothetical protein
MQQFQPSENPLAAHTQQAHLNKLLNITYQSQRTSQNKLAQSINHVDMNDSFRVPDDKKHHIRTSFKRGSLSPVAPQD